jgi:hypothetical protein
MKRLVLISFVLVLAAAGCQHPDEVILDPGQAQADTQLEIVSIAGADTATPAGSLDSSGVLPNDQVRFGAYLSLNRVVDDISILGVRQVRTRVFAKVLFSDRNQPVQIGPKVYGYFGVRLDSIKIDSLRLFQLSHAISVPTVGPVLAGFEYTRDLAGEYIPGKNYLWTVGAAGRLASFATQAPADLSVQVPVGGAKISRIQPLELRWKGAGNLTLVISEYYPLLKKAVPLVSIKPTLNSGRLILGPRVLALLPARHQYFVFTFILSTRYEQGRLAGYPADILVQASDVYNSYVEFL